MNISYFQHNIVTTSKTTGRLPIVLTPAEIARFVANIQISEDENECWEWIGGRTDKGYGCFAIKRDGNRYYLSTHRVALELSNGPLDYGLVACHRCDNPPCNSPHHLWAGTQQQNLHDRGRKGRTPQGESHWKHVLDEATVRWLRSEQNREKPPGVLAVEIGVSIGAIQSVLGRRTWKHV